MLDYIKGNIAELTPTYAVLDNHGIGYIINISLTTYDALPKGSGNEALLYVHEAIREDAHLLYGFATKREREAFLLLISVSGVGPNTARMILSSMSVDEFSQAIISNNAAMFKAVKGVGAKTAQRIIVDLKDKIKPVGNPLLQQTSDKPGEAFDEALAALVMLGFTQQASQKALKSLFSSQPTLTVEQAIKLALKMM
ncbi:MAG: Holliday junction branch migration protein RuvA [Muribaculaceae bacterium]|nr:Holliday junction branch migration protein RuvA [Muribaculaceae bacterium]MBR5686139.1 Holliday junction branch migration protein RuvA [Muribaculaceae bacterium]